jgi:protein SCO1/2
MKFKQPQFSLVARAAALAAVVLSAVPAMAQPGSRAMAPNFDAGASASAKGPLASPQDVVLSKVRWDQKLGQNVPLDATFKDESGQTVPLAKYFNKGKPVVLSLIFFNCTMLCSEVMNGSLELFKDPRKELGFQVGRDFDVVTISINPRETHELAAGKKKTYLSQLKNSPQAKDGWHLLTGNESQIKRVADSIGYHYTYNPAADDYAHPGGLVVTTPEGKVSKYFPGVSFIEKDVRLGLIESSHNRIGSPLEKLALFTCFHYNPVTGQYTPSLMKLVRVAALGTILLLGIGIWGMRRVDHKLKVQAEALGASAGDGKAKTNAKATA